MKNMFKLIKETKYQRKEDIKQNQKLLYSLKE